MRRVILFLWFWALPLESATLVIDPELPPNVRGRMVADEYESRDRGFGDTITELTMTLTNAAGRTRTRRLTWQTLESDLPNEGDKSLTLFHEPRDIEGTAFLSHTHIDRDDDQWLYLPSLKRVKRIASSNKSSAFMGSELAYEDLLSDDVEKFDYKWLREEPCGEWQCYVIERKPRYVNSGYIRQVVWIDNLEFRQVKIEYYDQKDRLKKTLTLDDYQKYMEQFWRSHSMHMYNHQSQKTTLLSFSTFQFQNGLTARDFDPSALRRIR